MSRRAVLASTGALALSLWPLESMPVRAKQASLRILAWPRFLPEDVLAKFTDVTGIAVQVTMVDSNEAFVNHLAASNGNESYDICSPSGVRALDWAATDLLQPWDPQRIRNIDKLDAGMRAFAEREWQLSGSDDRNGPCWLPYVWGAEAIGWRTDSHRLQGERPSFGDVWEPQPSADEDGGTRVMVSPHSGIVGAGLYLERIGELATGAVWSTYRSEAQMTPVFEQVTRWCIQRQEALRLMFWNDANSQREGFVNGQVRVGQTWDRPTLELREQGLPIEFQAPDEGALVWQNGFALVRDSKNVGAAHELLNYLYDPEVAGRGIDLHGFNSAVRGAEAFADDGYRQQFAASFPNDAIDRLNLWPPEPAWYLKQRVEFRDRLIASAPHG